MSFLDVTRHSVRYLFIFVCISLFILFVLGFIYLLLIHHFVLHVEIHSELSGCQLKYSVLYFAFLVYILFLIWYFFANLFILFYFLLCFLFYFDSHSVSWGHPKYSFLYIVVLASNDFKSFWVSWWENYDTFSAS